MLSWEKYKIQGEISLYVHRLSLLGYGYVSWKWWLRFDEAAVCIFKLEIVEVFAKGGSEPPKYG